MRYLDVQDAKYIAIGASLLGSGGGGDPFVGVLMAINAIKKYGKIKLLSVDEIKDDSIFAPACGVGAPSIGTEKIPRGNEYKTAFVALEKYTHKHFAGTFPIEAGGSNSMAPIVLAAQLHIPMLDCDTIGRAFPENQMTTLAINGVPDTPCSITDEKGNVSIVNTINPMWTEKLVRATCVQMGGSCSDSQLATGKQLKRFGVHNIVSFCEQIGKIVKEVPYTSKNSLKILLKLTHGYHLFDGKVIDISHNIKHGFNFGKISIKGINEFKDQDMYINFQNENLVAIKNGRIITSTPDLICLTDYDTLLPTDSENVKYGKRLTIIGIPCDKKWRTTQGIKAVGPRYFGYNFNYTPIEQLVQIGGKSNGSL